MLVVFAAGDHRRARRGVRAQAAAPQPSHLVVTFGALLAAFVWTCVIAASSTIFAKGSAGHVAAMGAVAVDRPTLFIQGTILVLAFVSVLLIADASHDVPAFAGQAAAVPGSAEEREGLLAGLVHTEIYPLTLFSVGGMLLFPASNDLLTMFVALEVLSLPLYLLCGLARRRRLLSHEAAMKYFLLGAFSSAFFLFGIAMLYGYSGSVSLAHDRVGGVAGNTGSDTLLFAGIALTGVGLLFKVGAVPFQTWKPDVYQGAPTPITALMASCTVVSAFGALLRVFYVAFGNLTWDWRPAMWVVAVLTMVVGAVIAITQTDVKRLLAYSSIAHAGFILTAVIAASVAGPVVVAVLPGDLRPDHDRRVRGDHAGPRPGRRGRPPVPLGRASASGRRSWPGSSRCSCSTFAGIPLTSRVHREVRGLPGGHRGRRPRRWSSSAWCPRRSRRSSTSVSSC